MNSSAPSTTSTTIRALSTALMRWLGIRRANQRISADALVGYKKSLRTLHFHTTVGVGELSLMALVSFLLALGIYALSVTMETGVAEVLWYALALFALVGVPAAWIFTRRYLIDRQSRHISDEEKARLLKEPGQ